MEKIKLEIDDQMYLEIGVENPIKEDLDMLREYLRAQELFFVEGDYDCIDQAKRLAHFVVYSIREYPNSDVIEKLLMGMKVNKQDIPSSLNEYLDDWEIDLDGVFNAETVCNQFSPDFIYSFLRLTYLFKSDIYSGHKLTQVNNSDLGNISKVLLPVEEMEFENLANYLTKNDMLEILESHGVIRKSGSKSALVKLLKENEVSNTEILTLLEDFSIVQIDKDKMSQDDYDNIKVLERFSDIKLAIIENSIVNEAKADSNDSATSSVAMNFVRYFWGADARIISDDSYLKKLSLKEGQNAAYIPMEEIVVIMSEDELSEVKQHIKTLLDDDREIVGEVSLTTISLYMLFFYKGDLKGEV